MFPSGSKYAVAFGAWAGLTEVIPYLGPVLGAMPPVIVALLHSPLTAVWVIIAYVGIQEVEGHIAAPLIMGTRFRVHPLVVIFAVLVGNQLHGIVGMFIAVPLIPLARETWVFFRAARALRGLAERRARRHRRRARCDRPAGVAGAGRGRPRPAHPARSSAPAGGGPTRRDFRRPAPPPAHVCHRRRFPSCADPRIAESAAEPANVLPQPTQSGTVGIHWARQPHRLVMLRSWGEQPGGRGSSPGAPVCYDCEVIRGPTRAFL